MPTANHLLSLTIDAVTLGSLYVLVALGYVLIYSVLGIFHLVHGDVVVLGGMVGIGVLAITGVPEGNPAGIVAVVLAAMFVSAAVCAGLSWGIEAGVYRRLRSRSLLMPLLAALGLSLILENLLLLGTSKDPIAFPWAAIPQGYIEIGETRLLYVSIVVIVAAVVLLLALSLFIKRSRLGTAMLAVAQDREAADLIGIPTRKITAITFGIAGGLAGAAGVLFGMYVGSLKWSMGLTFGIKGFSAALVGGLGSIAGAGLGGFVLAFAEVFGVGVSFFGFQLDSSWRDAVAFALVVVVLLIRPEGLLGSRSRSWRVRN